MITSKKNSPLRKALSKSKSSFIGVGLFSCAINVLMLTGPLFMLQIYDRVLSSRSVPTLIGLFALVVVLYLFLGLFDWLRMQVLARSAYKLDYEFMSQTNRIWVSSGLNANTQASRPANDLTAIRQFLGSGGMPAFFDLPWVPVYLLIVFLLHSWLGVLASVGAIIVVLATALNEWMTKDKIAEVSNWEWKESRYAESANRNAESILAMGMLGNITKNWEKCRKNALSNSQKVGVRSSSVTTTIKSIRMLLQSSILALGAYLAIFQQISPGTMIAASILAGRALSPIDQAVGNWKNFIKAREAYRRLSEQLSKHPPAKLSLQLPEPKGRLSLQKVSTFASTEVGSNNVKPILRGLNLELYPGDALGVIGPSGSGKSTLARLLVGLKLPEKGAVKLDGASFDNWDQDSVGQFVGYLPQNIELLPGSIRQNIARFDDDVSDEEVVEAAILAGVHELILELSSGYDTELSFGKHILSGGQVQRIALARAVLRRPPIVVLDEPNSNLDAEGDAALTQAITELRKHESCVIVMAHRPSAISAVNKILMLKSGRQMDFGKKNEVLNRVTKKAPALKVAN